MSIELMFRKLGMTRVYTEAGQSVPVTVLQADPNVVVQKKTEDSDGYNAVQLGSGEPGHFVTKAQRGHFAKNDLGPKRHLKESRLSAEEVANYQVGQTIGVDFFAPGLFVDAIGVSKGRGTSGVVKRYHFHMQKFTHGTHESFRHGGAIGCRSYPGRVLKGKRMAGRQGNERVTVRNLEVVLVDPERNLVYLRGAVPGYNSGVVRLRKSTSAQ